MKLFLSSTSVPNHLITSFEELVGKSTSDISMILIENAADPYEETKKGFVLETRSTLKSLGVRLELLDLRQYLHDQVAFKKDSITALTMSDDQALIIDNDAYRIVS